MADRCYHCGASSDWVPSHSVPYVRYTLRDGSQLTMIEDSFRSACVRGVSLRLGHYSCLISTGGRSVRARWHGTVEHATRKCLAHFEQQREVTT